MTFDYSPFFAEYEALVALSERTFQRVAKEYPNQVNCRIGCDDCCYAIFDLSLIEAFYISRKFNEAFEGSRLNSLKESANRSDRQTHKIKRSAHRDMMAGKDEALILMEMAAVRIECPLLNGEHQCELYAYRPITCRLYGIPTAIGGAGHSCGKSGFREGEAYPTVNLDPIQRKLHEISADLVKAIRSTYTDLSDMLVPLSMALITEYDETYFGVKDAGGEQANDEEQ